MNCPSCSSSLTKRLIHDVEIDECKHCEGIWFDHDELRKIKDKSDSDFNWMDFDILKYRDKFNASDSKKICPTCDTFMNKLNYDASRVEIDFCSSCQGIWLDKDELQGILDYLENEILTKSLGEYYRATLEEAKELFTGQESFISEWKDFSNVLRFLQYRILAGNPQLHDTTVKIQQNPFNK